MDQKHTYLDVENLSKTYLNDSSIELIKKAYQTASKMHEGQMRKSGDPYIQHPIEVAYSLTLLHTGPNTICAGFLHDVLEDTSMTKEEMTKEFNEEVSDIVDGVTKISKLKYMTKSKALAHNHEKLFIAMAKDVRVILVKLCDRLHNMRTIEFQPIDKQKRIAQETLDLYAPIAHRLGMYRIKAELEDLSFKSILPETYEEINQEVNKRKNERTSDIDLMETKIKENLEKNGFHDFQIKGRVKTIYSIYNKMMSKQKSIDDIFDLLALRIIVNNVAECYGVLGIIHNIWTPLPMRFKDYIAVPKLNLYQSLHTTICGEQGRIYEIQIRTKEMDEVAENGVAAHWAYKENSGYSREKEMFEISQKLKWYKDLETYAENTDNDPLNEIKDDLFDANVYVFSPNGDVYDFPSGATPLDFAYRIHSRIGNQCVGAICNSHIVPLTYELKTGDVIEIKTSNASSGPSEAWLKIAKTAHAKTKIRNFLNKAQRDKYIQIGTTELEKACSQKEYDLKLITDNIINEHFGKLNVNNLEDLVCEIGKGSFSAIQVLNKILGISDNKIAEEEVIKQYSENTARYRMMNKSSKNSFGIVVDGLTKAQIKLANCCLPVFGDKVYGYISKSNGIIVHRHGCPNIINSSERCIDVGWDPSFKQRVFSSIIKTFSHDRSNLVADMINIVNSCNVTILSVTSTKNINEECMTKFKLQVTNIEDLNKVILALNKMPEMYSVERTYK